MDVEMHYTNMEKLTGIAADQWAAEAVRHCLDYDMFADDGDAYHCLMYNRQYAALVIALNSDHLADDSAFFSAWHQPEGKNWTPGMLRVVANRCRQLAWEIEVWGGSQNPSRGDRPKTWEEFLKPAEIELATYVSESC